MPQSRGWCEDLHRADDALLDFVEGLSDRDAGPAAILVLTTARPELLERRPGWGAGGTTIRLDPLGDPDTTGLLATLLAFVHVGLSLAIVVGLANFMPLWLSALLVAIVLSIAAYVLINSALTALKKTQWAPKESIESIKEDAKWLKNQVD